MRRSVERMRVALFQTGCVCSLWGVASSECKSGEKKEPRLQLTRVHAEQQLGLEPRSPAVGELCRVVFPSFLRKRNRAFHSRMGEAVCTEGVAVGLKHEQSLASDKDAPGSPLGPGIQRGVLGMIARKCSCRQYKDCLGIKWRSADCGRGVHASLFPP